MLLTSIFVRYNTIIKGKHKRPDTKEEKYMKFKCKVCGYIYEGDKAPNGKPRICRYYPNLIDKNTETHGLPWWLRW